MLLFPLFFFLLEKNGILILKVGPPPVRPSVTFHVIVYPPKPLAVSTL